MPLSTAKKSQLKALAAAGDMVAQALIEANHDVLLSAGTEAANVIKVTGKVVDALGNPVQGVQTVVLTSIPVSGVGTMTDAGLGTVKAGSGTTSVWLETNAAGEFEVDVLNAATEENLIKAETANGDTAMLTIAFA